MSEKKDMTDRRKDTTGLVYQLIKKVNLLTKRVEELERTSNLVQKNIPKI